MRQPHDLARVLSVLLALLVLPEMLRADEERAERFELGVGVGVLGLPDADDEDTVELQVQLRFPAGRWGIRPVVGGFAAEKGDLYGYMGLHREFPLTEHFYCAISSAFGLLHEENYDLGGPIEFRSEFQLGFRLSSRLSTSVGLAHISNASIYGHNPGIEVLAVSLEYGL